MRRSILLAFPILLLVLLLQTAIVGRISLLSGNADLMLLVLVAWALQEQARASWFWAILGGLLSGLASGIPWYLYLACYLLAVLLARLMVRRIWKAPLLADFSVTFAASILLMMIMYLQRLFLQIPLDFGLTFSQVVLPSILLNLFLSIPVFYLIRDLSRRIYPLEVAA
jgi:rod shape-determining protein MreD